MKPPLCLYHRSDLDGKCSGFVVCKYVPDVELLGIEYGDELDFDRFSGRHVYLVDFSLQPWSEMLKLSKVASKVTWIDHHKSAIEEYQKQPIECDGIREQGFAACELCWQYFSQGIDIPEAIWLLGRYDVWDLDADERVYPFQMGMRLDQWNPDSHQWDKLISDDAEMQKHLSAGETVIRYQTQQHEQLMAKSFVHSWRELSFLAVNAGGINSQAFASAYNPDEHDAVMAFYFDGMQSKWTISLYSPDQSRDLSAIAKSMGGGGHAAACGFQVLTLDEIGM